MEDILFMQIDMIILRIAKAMMDHWNNDTCVGKYLKTIYEQRINKNKKSYDGIDLVNLM